MPATAGRVRMPANNRLSVSDSLRTSEIWQKSVGYDPYAPDAPANGGAEEASAGINDRAKGLFALARLTGSSSAVTPGGCKKCGQIGHLSFQCRNLLSVSSKKKEVGLKGIQEKKEEDEEEDEELDEKARKKLFGVETDSSSSSSDSSSSDSSSSSSDEDDKRKRKRKSSSTRNRRIPPKKESRKHKEKSSDRSKKKSRRR
eukprot:GHVS01051445.1.p1 GENE.GHVS01051445.1~~GHVS01051445.1.p1  ORF type:complete len:201 (+),score=55.22 GHVS01051445.1:120-722(+)